MYALIDLDNYNIPAISHKISHLVAHIETDMDDWTLVKDHYEFEDGRRYRIYHVPDDCAAMAIQMDLRGKPQPPAVRAFPDLDTMELTLANEFTSDLEFAAMCGDYVQFTATARFGGVYV